MAEARRRDNWDRTASTIAAVYNSQRTKKDGALSPKLFSPFTVEEAQRNAPKLKDPRILAALCGVKVEM